MGEKADNKKQNKTPKGTKQAQPLSNLIKQRQQKVEALREMGENPYRNGFLPRHTTGDVIVAFADAKPPAQPPSQPQPLSEQRYRLAGRIVEHRSFGKATFVRIADRAGRLQVYIRKDIVGEDAYKVFKKAEAWDFIGVEGFAFFTKTGELTLMAESVVFLTKATRPPPEKWSGLKDHETRYRQRYVDLVANPEVAEVFRKRSRLLSAVRRFFDERDFLEVETPILHTILGGAAARPFRTHHNALDMPLYLRIAPELFLKRLVVGGLERVYEVGRTFRNEGLSRFHNPEFTMIEFYWAYATYKELMDLTEQLIVGLADDPQICGSRQITYGGQAIDLTPPWPRIKVVEAVLTAGAKLTPALTPQMLEEEAALLGWLEASGLIKREDNLGEALRFADSHGKRIGVLFDELGEGELPADRPVFVVDYPAAVSPLSRRKDNDPDFVDRFELFIANSEVANGFSELNDPIDQRARFVKQIADAERGDEEAMEHDEDYCRALEYGLPPTAGEGIGIDRLVMMLCDQSSIRDVILFPHMRPEGQH